MSVIYLTYANKEDKPLSHLREEADEVNRLLTDRKLRNHFLLETDPFTSVEKIAYHINKYRDRLVFFGFSGHAGRDCLLTEEETAYAKGMAQLLGQCPNLQVVFLNGCSTAGQVRGLLNAGVKAVIGAHAPVEDELAKVFACHLFRALNEEQTLEAAYTHAKSVIETIDHTKVFTEKRDAVFELELEDTKWGLFCRDDKALYWKLPTEAQDYQLNTILKAYEASTAAKIFFVVDQASREKFYLKIKNCFRKEADAGQMIFYSLLDIAGKISREGTFTAVEAADVVVFMVNGLDFFNLWEKISWIKEAIRQFEKPVLFVKLSGEDESLESLAEEVGSSYNILPEYREMFKVLPSSALEGYIVNSFKGELSNNINKAIRQKGIAPEKLEQELLDFDLGPQTENFRKFIKKGRPYNLALLQGTERCMQNLLLRRLKGALPQLGNCPEYRIDFSASEDPARTEDALWRKLSEYMGIGGPEDDSPDFGYIAKTLERNLKKKDYLIVFDNVATQEQDADSANTNLDSIAAFWKRLLALLPKETSSFPYKLFVFAINRARHCAIDFAGLDLDTDNANGKAVVIEIEPIGQEVLETWHWEKQRRFKEPMFERLIEKKEVIIGDGYLSGVTYRICENLNCISTYANLER